MKDKNMQDNDVNDKKTKVTEIKGEWLELKEPLLEWYQKSHRNLKWRNTRNPYHIWISEIMLQQTRVNAVIPYYDRFITELPDVKSLSCVPDERLLKLWEGLGYYNRARNLKKAASVIMEEYGGVFPQHYEDVLRLPGIGEYTAGAICSICFDAPTPAVDGNVLRVAARLENCYDNVDEPITRKHVRDKLTKLYQGGDCGLLTQAFMELGAVSCIPNGVPKCEECPLARLCLAKKYGTWGELPVRSPKKKRKIVDKTVFVLHDEQSYGIRKRKNEGLLAGMWEFYQVDRRMNAEEAMRYISEQGFEPVQLEKEIPYTHIFTHVEWRMTAYYIFCRTHHPELTWVSDSELETRYALPTAYKFFIKEH